MPLARGADSVMALEIVGLHFFCDSVETHPLKGVFDPSFIRDYAKAHADIAQAVRLRPDYREAIEVLQKTENKLAETKKPEPVVAAEPVVTPEPVTAVEPVKPTPVSAPEAPKHVPEQLDLQGRTLTQDGKYPEAILALTEAIRLKPDFSRAYNARGFAYLRMKDFEHALADFDQAIKLDPRYENAIQNRTVAIRAMEHAFENRQAAKSRNTKH